MRAVDRALNTSSFIYFSGAEIQGQRKLGTIGQSLAMKWKNTSRGCLDIIYNEIEQSTEYHDYCIDILSKNFRALSAFDEFDIVIPYVKRGWLKSLDMNGKA